MKVLLGLLIGFAIGVAVIWHYRGQKATPTNATSMTPAETGSDTNVVVKSMSNVGHTVEEKLRSLKLRGEDIKEELGRTGRVMRQKAENAGQAISDATADARTTATIKGKLVADPDLSALSISVDTTDGVVTLSGTVTSEANIGKAMVLAMEPDNVHRVVSTLQVKPK